MPWLQKWNPKIDWVHYTIDFLASSPTDDYNQAPNSLDPDNEITYLFSRQYPQGVERTLHGHPSLQELCEEHVNKVTISTEIAMAEKPKEVPIPEFCTDFADVFSKKTYNQLLLHEVYVRRSLTRQTAFWQCSQRDQRQTSNHSEIDKDDEG